MATRIVTGQTTWSMSQDTEGHREYKIVFRVVGTPRDGPHQVLNTPGLPKPGDPWSFDGDVDLWATCRLNATVTPAVEGEPNTHWTVEFSFSTKPPDRSKCQDEKVDDPLLEPIQISGSFTKDKEEATLDRFRRPVTSSSWEQFRGPQVEFDYSRPEVKIKMNVRDLNLVLLMAMRDCVNDRVLWGLPRRTIKLSSISWERKYHGRCFKYYTWDLGFDIDQRTFDRDLLDEGSKVLHGRWEPASGDWQTLTIKNQPPDRYNPQHFDRFKDRKGENCRVILNGRGLPAGVVATSTKKYVAAFDPDFIFNINHPLTDTKYWVPLTPIGSVDVSGQQFGAEVPVVWDPLITYQRGNLVLSGGGDIHGLPEVVQHGIYVALGTSTGAEPPQGPFEDAFWRAIVRPGNPADAGIDIRDGGIWNTTTDFDRGTYVRDTTLTPTSAGYIHVEKYNEANFLLLGIPAIL